MYESGIVGGTDESPIATPTPIATKTPKSGGQATTVTFKKYTVKDGDTLSAIAVKYDTTRERDPRAQPRHEHEHPRRGHPHQGAQAVAKPLTAAHRP